MSSNQDTHRAAKADPAAVWAGKIDAAFRATCQKTVSGFFATGDMLVAAKADLPHGTFEEMVRTRLLFLHERTAQCLMAIAKDERLRKAHHGSLLLPPSWRTLYEITRLTDEELEKAVRGGLINQKTRRRDIEAIISARSLRDIVAAGSRAWATVADFEAGPRPRATVEIPEADFLAIPRARATMKISEADFKLSQERERERNTPVSIVEASRPGIARDVVRALDDLWRNADRCKTEELKVVREILLADPKKLARAWSAIGLLIRLKGTLEEVGARGHPHLR